MLLTFLNDFWNFLLPILGINLLVGIISFPISQYFFKDFKDRGYSLGHILGYFSLTFLYFFLVSLSSLILKNNNNLFTLNSPLSIVTAFTIWALINFSIYKKIQFNFDFKKILTIEIFFLIIICFYHFLNSYSPNIDVSGEKLMSLGFLNSLEIQKNLPLTDFWYAGEPLNYYYFGHIFGNLFLNLLGLKAIYGYFLIVIIIPGLILPAFYYLIRKVLDDSEINISNNHKIFFSFFGVMIYSFISPIKSIFTLVDLWVLNKSMSEIGNGIWDYSVRVIPSTIAENFNYGINFIPLHGHIFSLIISMITIYTIYTFFKNEEKFAIFNKYIILFGFSLGLIVMTNTWDVLFYLGLFHFLFISSRFEYIKSNFKNYISNSILMAWYLIITVFFWAYKFVSPGGAPGIVKDVSDIFNWTGLWGFYLIVCVVASVYVFRNKFQNKLSFVFLITIYSFLIALLLELIFFADANSGGEWYRANTYYKFSNQAFFMLAISCSVFLAIIYKFSKWVMRASFLVLTLLCFVLNYFFFQIRAEGRNFSGVRDVTMTVREFDNDLYEAIKFFQKSNLKNITILEASGYAYDNYNFVSSYTGHPTVLGWHNHQLTWRNSRVFNEKVLERLGDTTEVYTGDDLNKSLEIIKKYNVDFIVVSNSEKIVHKNINLKKLLSLGEVAFSNRGVTIIRVKK